VRGKPALEDIVENEGIPVSHFPRGAIVQELVDCPDHEARRAVLAARVSEVVEDCLAVLNEPGPGQRAGLWVQGCTLACPGCVSRDTWSHDDGTPLEVDDIVEWLGSLCVSETVDGLTISGGEPTEQCDGLYALLTAVNDLRDSGIFTGDVLCYTGLDEDAFMAAVPWAPLLIDAPQPGHPQRGCADSSGRRDPFR
jgi:4Fe-4S single cluster domain